MSEPANQPETIPPAGRKEGTFRGKWPLPEGARPVPPGERDRVDEASDGSFPASDPPPNTPERRDGEP